MRTIVVTGGAGFVGSRLCRRLAESGARVISLDNYFTGRRENHVAGVDYRVGHTRDIAAAIPETPDLVFHLGEYSRVEKSFEEPSLVWDLNKAGTFGVLEFCRARGVKLVYAGSSTKFADGGLGRDQSPYAWTKASNTELARNYGDWFGLKYAIAYFYNVYGPGERADAYGTLIEIFRQQRLAGRPLTVVAPGTQRRIFTHVDDIVDGLELIGEAGEGDEFGPGRRRGLLGAGGGADVRRTGGDAAGAGRQPDGRVAERRPLAGARLEGRAPLEQLYRRDRRRVAGRHGRALLKPGQPSYTAMRAAAHRAAHQLVEEGRVFADPLAVPVLGEPPAEVFGETIDLPATRSMRLLIAARSRFAEDSLAAAVARGLRQYVLLGAGLDTFAHRNPFEGVGLRVFEVDHPATQGWKRSRLAAAGLASPASLTFAPVDFERQTLGEGLAAAGFDAGQRAFFALLGVVIYLSRQAVTQTLRFIAGLPAGSEVVFDYGVPLSAYPPAQQAYHARREARMAALGEPWATRFDPAELAAELKALGFDELEDLGPAEILRRYLGAERPDGPGAHLMRAARRVRPA